MVMATSRNSRSRNGTRASTPQAAIDLLARRQSYWCRASSLRTVSSWKASRVRRLVEVQVAAEDLVGALAGEHHLDAHRLDPARHQVHRRRGADGGHVVGLDVADHVRQRVEALLHGEVEAVVHGAEVRRRRAARGRQVGRALQADGERVQARPPGLARGRRPRRGSRRSRAAQRGDQRRIESAGEQHAVGHVAHQLPVHRLLERARSSAPVGLDACRRAS